MGIGVGMSSETKGLNKVDGRSPNLHFLGFCDDQWTLRKIKNNNKKFGRIELE